MNVRPGERPDTPCELAGAQSTQARPLRRAFRALRRRESPPRPESDLIFVARYRRARHRRLGRLPAQVLDAEPPGFGGFSPFLALVQAVAVAVHLKDMNVVGETIKQGPCQALGSEHLGPFIEGKIAGQQG